MLDLVCAHIARERSPVVLGRNRWRSRLSPLLEAWEKMASSVTSSSRPAVGGSGSAGRRGSRRLSGVDATAGAEGRQVPPVDAFVAMENESAMELCEIVSASLDSVKKVRCEV